MANPRGLLLGRPVPEPDPPMKGGKPAEVEGDAEGLGLVVVGVFLDGPWPSL